MQPIKKTIPRAESTKNFIKYSLREIDMIISVYLPKAREEELPKEIKLTIEG